MSTSYEKNFFYFSLQRFFAAKREVLIKQAESIDTPHAGLLGAHRETLMKEFLQPLIPQRFSVGRGIVYGAVHRSREADLVIWDSANYPCITFPEHSHFFSESVRLVLEAKTRYSKKELDDVLLKCKSVREIVAMHRPNLDTRLSMIELDIASLREGVGHSGMLLNFPKIATAGFFYFGGQDFSLDALDPVLIEDIDEAWPDLLLFLDAGVVVTKTYEEDEEGVYGRLRLLRADKDSLMLFAAILMTLITSRSVQVEDPAFLENYVFPESYFDGESEITFRITTLLPSQIPLWSREGDY